MRYACMWTLIPSHANVHVHVLGHLTVFEWNSSLVLLSTVSAWLLAGLVTFKKRALYYILSHTHTEMHMYTNTSSDYMCGIYSYRANVRYTFSVYLSILYMCMLTTDMHMLYMYMYVNVRRSHSSPWLLAILSSRTSGVLPTILRMSGRMVVLMCGSLEGGRIREFCHQLSIGTLYIQCSPLFELKA